MITFLFLPVFQRYLFSIKTDFSPSHDNQQVNAFRSGTNCDKPHLDNIGGLLFYFFEFVFHFYHYALNTRIVGL